MLLGPERSTDVFCALHDTAALVIETEDGRNHVGAALGCFQRGGAFLLIANSPCRRRGPGTETSGQHAGISLSGLPATSTERGMALRHHKAVPIALTNHASRKQQSGWIPTAAAVRAGQRGSFALRGKDSGLLGIPGVEAVPRLQINRHSMFRRVQARLQPQRRLQPRGQGLPAFLRSAQDSLARFLR